MKSSLDNLESKRLRFRKLIHEDFDAWMEYFNSHKALKYMTPTDTVTTSLYLFDQFLNPLAWPTTPPAKRFDWACPTTIPYLDTIDVNEVVEPVYVPIDSTPPDWSWIYTLCIEEQ